MSHISRRVARIAARWMLASWIATGVAPGLAMVQAPDPGNYSESKYELHERRGVHVPMRDGVHLSADIYTPVMPGKLATILFVGPYDRQGMGTPAKARSVAKRGYVFITVDSRGRFDSEGVWDPFDAKHKSDGYDLVEWIAAQPWSNGKVGMWGGSYMGWTQWWTASTAPPHLAAIAPQVAPPDAFQNVPYQNGIINGPKMNWAGMMSGRAFTAMGEGAYGGMAGRVLQDFKHTPYIDINAYRGMENAPWFKVWYSQNKSTDPYWSAIAYQTEESYSRITVPSLAITGWFDSNQTGSPMNYLAMKKYGATPQARRPSMIIGPWTHASNARVTAGIDYGPEASIDQDGYMLRWYDHYLKGIDNGVENDPPVHVFVMGENKWHAEQDWPLPQMQATRYYFSSNGRANSLKGDGVLTTTPPRRQVIDTYVYDPRNPTLDPFDSFPNHNGHTDGAVDTRLSAYGDDVLVYQTPVLDSPIELTGPIEATLYAATSARDTDWMMRLVDVQPDGRSLVLTEGIMRARNRDPNDQGRFNPAQLSTIEPDKVYQYTIKFWRGTGNLFKRGHRIRVEISSSWYPYYLPNLNTGADNVAMVSIDEAVVARQKVHHGPQYPSHIVLPVIPLRGKSR